MPVHDRLILVARGGIDQEHRDLTLRYTYNTNFQMAPMAWIITKYLLTAGMVVFVSEVAKRSDRLGGLIAALPLMTLLTLTWLYIENQPEEKIANHVYYTFWYVIPTLPIFLLFPYLLPKIGFWLTMLASVVLTVICYGLFALVMKNFGVELL